MIVAVAARSLERAAEFADRHNIEKAYGSYEELARDASVEVVYISTIHPQHAPLCKLALSHGKHVLCEKPMTMNLKQTKEVFKLAKAKGLFIMEVRIRSSSRAVDSKSKCDSHFGVIGQKVISVIIEMKVFGATLSLNIMHSDVPVGEGGPNEVLYREVPPGGSNPYPLVHKFSPKWYPFHIPTRKLHPFLIPNGYARTIEFQSFWFSCSKGASFYVLRIVISDKIPLPFHILSFSHHLFHLQQILRPFHILN